MRRVTIKLGAIHDAARRDRSGSEDQQCANVCQRRMRLTWLIELRTGERSGEARGIVRATASAWQAWVGCASERWRGS